MSNLFFYDSSHIADRCIWKWANSKSQCSIGKITGINTSPVSVNVQPLVNYFDQNIGTWVAYPVLEGIPIAQAQQAAYSINLPVNIGDTGIILWFDREAYSTLSLPTATTNTPDSGAMDDKNACVFIPMLPIFAQSNTLRLKTSGVDIMSEGVSLLHKLIDLCTQLGTLITDIKGITVGPGALVTEFSVVISTVGPVVGPITFPVTDTTGVPGTGISSVPKNSAAFDAVANAITAIKNDLTTFLGSQP